MTLIIKTAQSRVRSGDKPEINCCKKLAISLKCRYNIITTRLKYPLIAPVLLVKLAKIIENGLKNTNFASDITGVLGKAVRREN